MNYEIIDVHQGSQSESWIIIYADGRLILHSENDGYACLRHGLNHANEEIEFTDLRQHNPHIAGQM